MWAHSPSGPHVSLQYCMCNTAEDLNWRSACRWGDQHDTGKGTGELMTRCLGDEAKDDLAKPQVYLFCHYYLLYISIIFDAPRWLTSLLEIKSDILFSKKCSRILWSNNICRHRCYSMVDICNSINIYEFYRKIWELHLSWI